MRKRNVESGHRRMRYAPSSPILCVPSPPSLKPMAISFTPAWPSSSNAFAGYGYLLITAAATQLRIDYHPLGDSTEPTDTVRAPIGI